MQIQLTLFVPHYIYIWCSDQVNRSSELWLWKHQTSLQKMLKFHGTKIIGWSCFAVIFHPSKRPTTLRNQVTDYDCGMKLIGIFTQHLEGVFSWPLKASFSPQTQFHRIILGTPGNISQLKPCAGSVCAQMHVGFSFLCCWCAFLGYLPFSYGHYALSEYMCECVHIPLWIRPEDEEQTSFPILRAPLQHHPWALFWSPHQPFSTATS